MLQISIKRYSNVYKKQHNYYNYHSTVWLNGVKNLFNVTCLVLWVRDKDMINSGFLIFSSSCLDSASCLDS